MSASSSIESPKGGSRRDSGKLARRRIDDALDAAGWQVQNANAVNLHAGRGGAIREFRLNSGHGYADYLLYVDGKAVGVLEAKRGGRDADRC